VPDISHDLRAQFGEIDISLFDQILKGRFDARRRVLDAGCGDGRNLIYFLRNGFDCFGVDADPTAIASLRRTVADLSPRTAASNFVVGDVEDLAHADASMDAVLSSAVLHFARDDAQFARMVEEMWRVLSPGGLLFARLASNIGIEDHVPLAGRRVRLPDGSERFVVDEAMLLDWTHRLGGRLADPIKTTNVQQLRCMTTWCLLKHE
jgi:SAM-dependent methyltransferase